MSAEFCGLPLADLRIALRIVHRAAVALFASGFLQFFELLLLFLQLRLHALDLLLLLALALVPLHTITSTIGGSKTDRVVQLRDLSLQGCDLGLLGRDL